MTEVRWTPQAANDLQAIYDFIARDSHHYAQLTVEGILAAIDRLEQFPLMGRHVPESARDDFRELINHRTGSFIESARSSRSSRSFALLVYFHRNSMRLDV